MIETVLPLHRLKDISLSSNITEVHGEEKSGANALLVGIFFGANDACGAHHYMVNPVTSGRYLCATVNHVRTASEQARREIVGLEEVRVRKINK
jgi:hypothetical protein